MEKDENLAGLAKKIRAMGMAPAAVFLLESHLPLRNLFYNLSHLTHPILSPLCGFENYAALQGVLKDEEKLNLLLEELEQA